MSLPRSVSYPMPTELPENRAPWRIDPDRAVLLVHDAQEYFIRAFDRTADPIRTMIAHVDAIRTACRAAGVPIMYTAQPGDQDPSHRALLTDFWGPGLSSDPAETAIIADLAPEPDDVLLTKWRYSAFAKTDLRQRLSDLGRDQLIVTGVYAHIGCLTTALDGFMQDVEMFLVSDGLADFSEAEHRQALDYAAARCAVVTPTAHVLSGMAMAGVLAG
ncbi:isochorismatase family protein [Rhodococcus sp. PAM 2766]|uniref:Isochorismatase family protein n=1 Tax=Rhodococcus parequi TaxID=3137122 RepID=A0ABW9FFJ9_9NOCA